MSKKLLLLGTKEMAKRAIEAIGEQSDYSEISLLDIFPDDGRNYPYPIISGSSNDLETLAPSFTHGLVCIADPSTRLHFLQKLLTTDIEVPNVIHPHAYISASASLGVGIMVGPFGAIQSDAKIGNGCFIETGSVVEHDNELGDCVALAPNSSTMGHVKIGSRTFVAAGVCINNDICIGENVLVAAGAVVTSDIPDNVMVAGCPAKIKKAISEMKHLIWPGIYPEGRF